MYPKVFMSVGDWTSKIWHEDQKTPIMQTRYHSSYLTSGCWSPSRAGLFFLTRMDGFLDVWDFFYRQNEVAYSQKVSDSPLTTISVSPYNANNPNIMSYAAIGDADGTVSMMQLSRPLYEPQNKEKDQMVLIFEREFRKERNLEINARLAAQKKPTKTDGKD
jgi:dynein intermediate chain 2